MDITLIRTFLEVAATGSFVGASERLLVTQSAVSLRIQRLEDTLGKQLFNRSKSGAALTSAGREFEQYAVSLTKIWEEARQQIGVPDGYEKSLSVAAQYSLWPRLGFRWLDQMQRDMPTLNLRAEVGLPDRITRYMLEGVVQVSLMYNAQLRSGLSAKKVLDDELVLAASFPATLDNVADSYVYVDWGPEFMHAHALELPLLVNPGRTLSLGSMAADYIISRRAAAYLPARHIKRHIDAGQLSLVPDAPRFPYPIWSVWRDDLDADIKAVAENALDAVRTNVLLEQQTVISELTEMSAGDTVQVLGEQSILKT